jgi:hypothetical protein
MIQTEVRKSFDTVILLCGYQVFSAIVITDNSNCSNAGNGKNTQIRRKI